MFFTKIEIHNFGIYKGTHEMLLNNQAGARNITLVGGLNGRGKTTLHDAIIFCLYGKLALTYIQEKARSYDRFLLEHINKEATDDVTYIAITLNLEDGTILRVKRSWQKKGSKAEIRIDVEKNGSLDKYLGESWSYYVEEILPFGIARFFFFNNEKITQLADDTSFEQIKGSIRSALGIMAIEKAIEHVDEVIRRKQQALDTFENSEENQAFQQTETEISQVDDELEIARRSANDLQRKAQEASVRYELREQEFWAAGGELSRNRENIKREMQLISSEMDNIQLEITQQISDPSTPLYMCRSLVMSAFEEEMQNQYSNTQQNIQLELSRVRDKMLSELEKAKVDSSTLKLIVKIWESEFKQYESNLGYTPHTAMSSTSMMLFEHLIKEVFNVLEPRVQGLLSREGTQENELLALDAHLEAADDKSVAMKLFEALKDFERAKTVAEVEYQRQLDQIQGLQNKRDQLVARRIQLIKAITDKENINDDNVRIIKYAAMSMEVLTEFKTRLQRSKVSQLSKAITDCFKTLVGKDSLIDRITIDGETLDITIIDVNGEPLLKNQLSAGEQQMFAVSVVWALALSSGYKAPVIIDTPMARLDSKHRENFVTRYLPAASSQVVVLSTDEEISGKYLDMIRENILDSYTLLYHEDDRSTTIEKGYFQEVRA